MTSLHDVGHNAARDRETGEMCEDRAANTGPTYSADSRELTGHQQRLHR